MSYQGSADNDIIMRNLSELFDTMMTDTLTTLTKNS